MKDLITKVMILITIAALLLGLSSCYTERTAQRQVDKAHHKYPLVPAKLCAEKFPPTDSVSIIKEYIQGEDIVYTDTLVERDYMLDTLILTKYITKTVKTTDTLRDTKYVQQENKAMLVLKEGQIKELNEQIIQLSSSRDSWRKWSVLLGALVFSYLLFRIVKFYLLKK